MKKTLEQIEAERLSRRQALGRIGFLAGMSAVAALTSDDLLRKVGVEMQKRAGDNKTVNAVAKELQAAGVAQAVVSPCLAACGSAEMACLQGCGPQPWYCSLPGGQSLPGCIQWVACLDNCSIDAGLCTFNCAKSYCHAVYPNCGTGECAEDHECHKDRDVCNCYWVGGV
jgi:hypothetical protein